MINKYRFNQASAKHLSFRNGNQENKYQQIRTFFRCSHIYFLFTYMQNRIF